MSENWQKLFDSWKDEAAKLLKEEIRGFIAFAKSQADAQAQQIGNDLERYLTQLALGEITTKDLEMYVRDMERLARMKARKAKVAAKAGWQRITDSLSKLIIGDLLKRLGL